MNQHRGPKPGAKAKFMSRLGTLVAVLLVGASIYLGLLIKLSVTTGVRLFSQENVQGSMWFAVIILGGYLIAAVVLLNRRP